MSTRTNTRLRNGPSSRLEHADDRTLSRNPGGFQPLAGRGEVFCARYWDITDPQYTYGSTWALEGPFTKVRLLHGNYRTQVSFITKAFIAPVASVNAAGGYAPIDAAGNPVAMQQVTYGGATNVPGAVANPSSDQDSVDGYLLSDWMDVRSIARADGKGRPYLHFRCYRGAAAAVLKPTTIATSWQDPGVNLGREIVAWAMPTDMTGTPNVGTPTTFNYLEPMGIITNAKPRGISILAEGDSLQQGLGTTGDILGWPGIMRGLLPAEAHASLMMLAKSGSTTPAIYQRAIRDIDALTPNAIIYPVFSPNDAPAATDLTQVIADAAYQRMLDVVNYAGARSVMPFVMGTIPWLYDATRDAIRLGIRARALADAAAGKFIYLDFDPIVSDGNTPSRLAPAYLSATTGSAPHPNDAGHAAMARYAMPFFARLLGA